MLAHAPMEPPAAVAEFKDGKVVTYCATQNPQAVQETVGKALGIPKESVICHVTLLGGGFGRKSKPDYVAEAALLSRQVGKPVKVVWSREDDLQFDYFHSPAGMYLKAAVDAQGRPTAWLQRTVFPPIGMQNNADEQYGSWQLGMGWTDLPYRIPNLRVENGPAKAHVRIGWLRAVANVWHAFAVQSFTDELAAAAKRDRVEYLLDLIGAPRIVDLGKEGVANAGRGNPDFPFDTARLRHVIELAAERSGWAKKKPGNGRALGIAAHYSFLSYVAAVVEVETDANGVVRIPRVDIAVDAGRIINPDRVRAQFEGAAVFGTSLALMGEITAAGGPDPADELPQLPCRPDHRGAVRDPRAHGRERSAARRRRRARRATDRASVVQRDLRLHGQARARAADSEAPGCRNRCLIFEDGRGRRQRVQNEGTETNEDARRRGLRP